MPSIPGLGFSDAFTSDNERGLAATAEVFNALMKRLGYEFYIASATGSGLDSPANIDYHLARLIGENFTESCLGVHLLEPPVKRPRLGRETLEWVKFGVARFFHASIWGYKDEDWVALRKVERAAREAKKLRSTEAMAEAQPLLSRPKDAGYGAAGMVGLREPNTLAYALCDSPVGLLSLVCSGLRRTSPKHRLSDTEIIDITQFAWLPGPEAGMRFWSGALKEAEGLKKAGPKSRVAVTVFGSDGKGYTCPAWSGIKHEVIFSQRARGRPGLVSWERTDLVIAGIRGLANELAERDGRLKVKPLDGVVIRPAEDTILEMDEETSLVSEHSMQLDVESPDTIVAVQRSYLDEQEREGS